MRRVLLLRTDAKMQCRKEQAWTYASTDAENPPCSRLLVLLNNCKSYLDGLGVKQATNPDHPMEYANCSCKVEVMAKPLHEWSAASLFSS